MSFSGAYEDSQPESSSERVGRGDWGNAAI